MTVSPPRPATPFRLPARYVLLGLGIILAIASLILCWGYMPNYGAGVDEASYLLATKGIATRGDPAYRNPDPVQFVPENMVEAQDGLFYPIYPIGYPMLAAIAYRVGGPAAAFLVNPILVLVGLVGVYLLARLFVNEIFALAAAFFMGAHPAVLYYGEAAMSHAADFACSTWCLFFACWWYQRPRLGKAIAAGLLLGYAISIRYTEALLALPVGFLIVARITDARPESSAAVPAPQRRGFLFLQTGAGMLAFAAGILPLLIFHMHAFGSPWTTGYSLTGHAGAFSVHSFLNHAPYALATLCKFPFGLPVLFPLGLIGIGWLVFSRGRAGLFLLLWCVPSLLLYMAYYWITQDNSPQDNWIYSRDNLLYVRFFLTLYPGFLIAALLLAERVLGKGWPAKICIVGLAVVLGSINLLVMPDWDTYMGSASEDQAAVELVRKSLPPDSAVVADFPSFSLIYYTDMTVFYVRYFSPAWVEDRLRPPPPGSDSPPDFNPRRRARFAHELGGRTQDELSAILCQRLLALAKAGHTTGLVISTDDPPWYNIVEDSFTLVPIDQDPPMHLLLFRLDPKAPATAK
jgi:4-amino-4-deoxy-L-arabinose transferase-like glycosyltransferase